MLRSEKDVQNAYELAGIEELVPKDHLLRIIQKYNDFSLIGYLFGICSERQLEKEVRVNIAH